MGGLLSHELVDVLRAAREVGAAVVPIDRPRTATRNRVATRLWHPRLLQGLFRYGSHSLRRRELASLGEVEALRRELETLCFPAYEVLLQERCTYMAQQVRAATAPGAEAIIICGALHCAALGLAL